MKLKLLTILFTFTIFTFASAQTNSEKDAVTTAVENLRKAMLDADKTALENLTADELSYGHSGGKVEDKKTFIDAIVSKKNEYKQIAITDQTIKPVGKNLAIVRHKMVVDVIDTGALKNISLGVLQIWQKQKGKWKLMARQAFKL